MSRVLVTGGAGAIGTAVVRRLLGDPDFEVRVSDQRPIPDWMREGCEIHAGDLSDLDEARKAIRGCSHVIHLETATADPAAHPFTTALIESGVHDAVFGAAIDHGTERFTLVSSAAVYERAEEFPTTEAQLDDCRLPRGAYAWSRLAGEVLCRAAHDEFDLPFTICRPCDPSGPGEDSSRVATLIVHSLRREQPVSLTGRGEDTRTPTYVVDVADGIVTAMAAPAGLNEDFNLAAADELTVAEIARLCWEAVGNDPDELELEPGTTPAVARRWPSAEKAGRLLGWQASTTPRDGIARTAAWLRDQGGVTQP